MFFLLSSEIKVFWSRYQKGKTNLDYTEARDSEWQWNPLGHMQVCTSLQTDNHASTPPLSFLQARCPSCRPTNSVKAVKATNTNNSRSNNNNVQRQSSRCCGPTWQLPSLVWSVQETVQSSVDCELHPAADISSSRLNAIINLIYWPS